MIQRIFLLIALVSACCATAGPMDWPKQSSVTKPWAYWWWMGSAVDETNLTKELTRYRDAGYGGVHIIPIYGAKGWEDKYISYLSPRWMEILNYTVSEAGRLGLGVDMTTGTGWCFGGGPNVGELEGNASVVVKTFDVAAAASIPEKLEAKKTQALVAFGPNGAHVELMNKLTADGTVDWVAPGDSWRVYAVSQKLSAQKVKRAAPGGEGPMLNLFYPEAMRAFLGGFSEAFDHYKGAKPRAQYHDSYEYRSDWSPDFFAQFEKRRGYKLQSELPSLFGTNQDDRAARVKSDYRETVSDLMVEETLPMWVKWSHQHGFITRNEAHGSPGNLLDLYAVADIPETEVFRTDRNTLVSKFAPSAAHVTGKNLVSSETCTWLKEHFTETLADVKYLLDEMFMAGVNHVFYHGTCYSPDEAGWPGWVFYASTEMNPRNPIWHDAPAINAYISRCQSVLQSGKPDNEVLLYWPVYDLWHNPTGRLSQLQVESQPKWFGNQTVGDTAKWLWDHGYGFDYVSDRQLATAKFKKGKVEMPGGATYSAIVVPECKHMPTQTLASLVKLVKAGANIIFEGDRPSDVPGFGNLEVRRAEFQKLLKTVADVPWQLPGANSAGRQLHSKPVGRGFCHVGDLELGLNGSDVKPETMVVNSGVRFIRRKFDGGHYYFMANHPDAAAVDAWITLSRPARSVVIMDPLTGHAGTAAVRTDSKGQSQVYLQLPPGGALVMRCLDNTEVKGAAWAYWEKVAEPVVVNGIWRVDFVAGGPELPKSFDTENLGSWTEEPGMDAFGGTAKYIITFDAPKSSSLRNQWLLNLGDVRQSARVKLNGKDFGTLLAPPFQVVVDSIKPQANLLEVEVTSVAANRIRDLDRRGVKWKNFHDINFVNKDYKPFDASDWPVADCGLLGPVTLTAVASFQPD